MNSETKIEIKREDTFKVIQSAVNKMVDLIKLTYGPASNKVIIDKQMYKMVVDDGVQIARDIELEDPAENAVVNLVRETAIKTNDRVGDGTTGALIILQAIINEVSRRAKFDGRKIELELKKGLEEVKAELLKNKKEIKTKEDLKKVALVSFDNEKIAEMLSDLYHKLGKDAIITVDKSPTMETFTEMEDGVKIKRGYVSPYMVTNPERMETVLEKPYILITDYRLVNTDDILPVLELIAKNKKNNLVIISESLEGSALATVITNLPQVFNPQLNKRGSIFSVSVNIPKDDQYKVMLEDLATITGATVFTETKGNKLKDCTLENLGRADKFICRKDESIIVGHKGDKAEIEKTIDYLKKAIGNEKEERKRKALEKRLGRLTNKLAVIKVGASTDNEQKALKYKVEDAVHSLKSALTSGVVCGAGLSLARIETSSKILNEALQYPASQLLENMGLDDTDYLKENEAINVVTGEKGNYMKVGVIDPVDVLIAGVESAVSIASILLTSSGIICESLREVPKTRE